jgi:hypothetical protein
VLERTSGALPKLLEYGQIIISETTDTYGDFPFAVNLMADDMAGRLYDLVLRVQPQEIVIESTVKGRNRWSQQALEFLHCLFIYKLIHKPLLYGRPSVKYVSPSTWRKHLTQRLSVQDKLNNKLVKTAKTKEERKRLRDENNLRGKINKKHLAIRWAKENYKLDLKVKQDDVADALSLGVAYSQGCNVDTGMGH